MVRVLRARTELIKRHVPARGRWLGLRLQMLWPLSRHAALRVAGTVLRRPALSEKAAVWGEIWRRRDEWRDGFR